MSPPAHPAEGPEPSVDGVASPLVAGSASDDRLLLRGSRGLAVPALVVGAGIGALALANGSSGQLLVALLIFGSGALLTAAQLVARRRSAADAALALVFALLLIAVALSLVLPQSTAISVLCCVAVLAIGLQYLPERRLALTVAGAGVAVVSIVVSRQSDRPPGATRRDTPLWVLDGAEMLAAIALVVLVAFLLLRFRRRLEGTIADLRSLLLRERALHEENERRAAENAALDVARRTAEEQGRARGEFLAHVSHELRTPLNAVIGLAEILGDADLDRESAEHVRIVRRSGDHLLRLVNDVLDLSRIDAGAVSLGLAETDLDGLLEGVVEVVRPAADEHRCRVAWNREAAAPRRVLTDPNRLRQILVNLVANGVRFAPDGEVRITVARGPDDGLRITVADSGIGIEADRLARIFEPFETAGRPSSAGAGAGLGLAISRNLARLMGGELTVASRLGRGSTFTLELPPADPAPPAPGSDDDEERASDPDMAARLPLRILVVDDDRTNQLVTTRLLQRLGYAADVAADGVEALEAVARRRYDVVLMDLHLPRLDGQEATRAIHRELPADRRPYVVAFTAAAFERDRRASLEAGMDDFVTKPASGATLAAALRRAADARRRAGAEPAPETG
jgi:signal transduction histidine kinase/CheY-like chemotaxis protein